MPYRFSLLAGAAILFAPTFVHAQTSAADQPATASAPATSAGAAPSAPAEPAQPLDEESEDEGAIVVTGSRTLPGSAIGDIPAENTLDSRDVRATGATNITELLDAIAPEIGSARGRGAGAPVLLLSGQRISGFRELRDIPTEAITRVEILPEEVALKYGYRADQKVVNIVLRNRFRSTAVQVAGTTATDGGYAGGKGDVTRLMIDKAGRTTFNLHAEGNGMLTESERNILLGQQPVAGTSQQALAARSLIGTKRDIRGSATINRKILGDVSATFNGELEHQEGRSLIGLGDTLLEPLARNTSSNSAHAGMALNGTKGQWHWTVTGNADIDRSITRTDRDDTLGIRDRARETSTSGDLTATANGKLFKLPAGDASTTLTLGGTTEHLDSHRFTATADNSTSLGRTTGQAAVNFDLPISRRNRDFSALGNLTLNANAEINQLSDFGTLTTLGAGANWSPLDRLNFITSWTREEGAPTVNQLGDAVLETPGARIFDFTTGDTVLVTAVTGGNPDLLADKRSVWKLGANWQPFANTQLRLRADYVHSRIDRPISGITVTEAIEAAFPGRFQRDASGRLLRVDLRPVNFDSARKDTLRIGFDFSKPLKSQRPSQSVMDQVRAQFGGGRNRTGSQDGQPQRPPAEGGAPPPDAGPPPGDRGSARDGGFGGGFGGGRAGGRGFFGGGNRGRLQFSLTDTITFADKVTIAPGVPQLDYLNGDASGSSGGTPRHQVEAQAGWSNNGLGARIGANWRSGTTVNTLSGDNLRFSPLATFDLRLFANPGDVPEMALKHPWLRGTQLRLEVKNFFDSRPKVHDALGNVPSNYQPDLLDPLGRTIMISFRKLFSPPPSFFRREREQQGAAPAR
ncbi:MAG TPA: TonB-dependent receptor [Sphingomicrobium sp.]|nr:TonB-dependent receptor [Sphingomicrobium sp.]